MIWKEMDKSAGIHLMVELAARMEPKEIFKCLAYMSKEVSDRIDLTDEENFHFQYPGLNDCIKRCLDKHKL